MLRLIGYRVNLQGLLYRITHCFAQFVYIARCTVVPECFKTTTQVNVKEDKFDPLPQNP